MGKRFGLGALAALILVALSGAAPVYADAAPPQNPPGANVETGAFNTKVQMVSEAVLMTIEDYTPDAAHQKDDVPPFMIGHVDATFNMQNQGDSAESFDVWFPLGVDNGYSTIASVENFRAWVGGVEATQVGRSWSPGDFGVLVPWATWHADFPPHTPVTLRVTYDTFPTGYPPYGNFQYILQTGAGWYGAIGQGTVTFRLPYDISEQNVAIRGGDSYFLPSGGPFTVSDTDVVWQFTDLEPSAKDNVSLEVLAPAVWRGIEDAQKQAAANPSSEQAQLDLADAAQKGLYVKNVLEKVGGTQKLIDLAAGAYAAALKLDPKNIDIYVHYLNLLDESRDYFSEPPDPRFRPLLDQALRIAPDNQDLLGLERRLADHINLLTQGAGNIAQSTRDAPTRQALFAEATDGVNLTATAIAGLRLTPYGTPSPVEMSAPLATDTATAPATSAPTAAPTPPTAVPPAGNVEDWTTLALPAVIAVLIGIVWLRRRRSEPRRPDERHSDRT